MVLDCRYRGPLPGKPGPELANSMICSIPLDAVFFRRMYDVFSVCLLASLSGSLLMFDLI
jgi:hypothetical protein